MITAGSKVPSFSTIDQNEQTVSSSDWTEKSVVLYFYPKDDTPGCTAEACNLRDNYEALLKEGFTIYGISPDKAAKHRKFIEKYSLPFDLLVDENHAIAEQFGVWVEKSMYGRKYMGIARSTFVIENEIVVEVIDKVKTSAHAEQLLGFSR